MLMKGSNLATVNIYDLTLKNIFMIYYMLMLAYIVFYPLAIVSQLTQFVGRFLIIFSWIVVIYILVLSISRDIFRYSMLVAATVIPSMLFASGEVNLSSIFQGAGSFLALVFLIESCGMIKITPKMVKVIAYSNIVMVALFLIYSFMPFAYDIATTNIYVQNTSLTMGYANPNSSAMMLMYTAVINLIANRCKIYNKYITALIQTVLIYLIIRTDSRASLLCILILTVVSLLKIKRIPEWVPYCGVAVPLLYISILPFLSSIGYKNDLVIFGKSLYTGREDIFSRELEGYNDWFSWLFGDLFVGGFANHHNAFLSIFLSCGLVGTVIYIFILIKAILPYAKNTNSISYIAICSILVFIIHASAESAFLMGSIPYGIMTATIFLLMSCKKEDFI